MPSRNPIRKQVDDSHTSNPEVYEWFEYFAKEMLAAGVTKVGATCLWERIRYSGQDGILVTLIFW